MNIVVDLGNRMIAEAICQLLLKLGDANVVLSGKPSAKGSTSDVLLVDIATLRRDLLAQYPDAKVLLIDTGMEPDKLCSTLLSYRIHGVLPTHTELHLFKKALTAISEGKLWIDNGTVKALLHDVGNISPKGKNSHVTSWEQEIIEYTCQGLSNKEIVRRLTLSPNTVKTHLNTIFRKFNVTRRSKLMALATHRPLEASV